MDHRILIGSLNRLDGAAVTGGAWAPTLPLANIKSRQIAKVARSVDTTPASTTMVLDFGRPRTIRLVCLIGHNGSLTGRAHFELSDRPDFSGELVYQVEADIWTGLLTSPWSLDALEWEDDKFWLGGLDAEEIEGFTAVSTHILPEPRSARYLRITILDPDNADGFFQIGRVFAGPALSPRINYAWGGTLTYEFATAIERAIGGAEFFDPREPIRVFRFALQHLGTDEAYGAFLEMVRRQGVHGEVFVVPDPSDDFNGIRRNFLGRIGAPSALEQVQWEGDGPGHAMAFEIRELR